MFYENINNCLFVCLKILEVLVERVGTECRPHLWVGLRTPVGCLPVELMGLRG